MFGSRSKIHSKENKTFGVGPSSPVQVLDNKFSRSRVGTTPRVHGNLPAELSISKYMMK
jgi:hypothetical protein